MAGRSSSGGCQMALVLQLAVALLVMTARVGAQGVLALGACREYQSATTFDDAYIAKLTSSTDGYALLLTSDRPRTSNCQRLTLYGNGTFLFSYNDDYNRLQNHSSTYSIKLSSFTRPGYIQLRMPVALFGATLTGDLRLNVLLAEEDFFVVASCWEPVPLLRSEFVHVFVPAAKVDTLSPPDLQRSLITMGVPHATQMREVYQGCFASLRFFLDTQGKADLYNFLVKIGLAPPLPIRRLHEIRRGVPTQLYSAPSNFIVPHSGYHMAPSATPPVQSFIYGPSSTAGQGQNGFHFAPSASPPVQSFVYGPSSTAGQGQNGYHFALSASPLAQYFVYEPSSTAGQGQNGYHFAPSASPPVQSFVYEPSSTAGQGQSFVYNAALPPSNHIPPSVVSYVPHPSGVVPTSSDVNYDSQSFSFSSPGVARNSLAVSHGVMGPVQSSSVISYHSPGVSYPSINPSNPQTLSYNPPVVVNYA